MQSDRNGIDPRFVACRWRERDQAAVRLLFVLAECAIPWLRAHVLKRSSNMRVEQEVGLKLSFSSPTQGTANLFFLSDTSFTLSFGYIDIAHIVV
jgi:hypothetical protein